MCSATVLSVRLILSIETKAKENVANKVNQYEMSKHRRHGLDFLCWGLLLSWRTVFPFSLTCRCAKKSADKGYSHFGLQFYGECWSDSQAAERFDLYGKSGDCKGFGYKNCDDQDNNECVGTGNENYVHRIVGDGGKEKQPKKQTHKQTKTYVAETLDDYWGKSKHRDAKEKGQCNVIILFIFLWQAD